MSHLMARTLPVFLITSFVFAAPLHAAEMDLAAMQKIVDQRLQNDVAKQDAIEAGKERTILCQYCHGEDGNSLKSDVPNLAGQNASYLLAQIDEFAKGTRKDYVMNKLADNFSPEDKVNVAVFYYSMAVKPQTADEKLAAKGKPLFESVCSNCHGPQGYGNQRLPRLAGQQAEYIRRTLKTFRGNANSPAAVPDGNRRSQIMEMVAKSLTDEQIEAAAAYVGQLP